MGTWKGATLDTSGKSRSQFILDEQGKLLRDPDEILKMMDKPLPVNSQRRLTNSRSVMPWVNH